MTDRSVYQRLQPQALINQVSARNIPLQRWLALAMITLEAVMVAYLSRTSVYPALIICVAAYGTLSKVRFEMDRQRTYDIIALFAVVFVIKYMITPDNPRYISLFPSQQMAFTLSQYVLAMQCVQFYLKRRDDRLPFSFPGIGVIALVCATMVSLPARERSTVQAFCVGFAVLAVLYCDASRRFIRIVPARRFGRPIATVLVLVAVGSLGWFTASSMFHYERHVEEFVNRFLQQEYNHARIGFSESSTLGSISLKKNSDSERTALRVVSTIEPGYFRVRAYDVYENQKWLLNTDGHALTSENTTPNVIGNVAHTGRAFRISTSSGGGTQRFEVWPDADLRDTFAGLLRTSWLYADARIVTVDTHGIMRSGDAVSGVPYTLVVSDSSPPATAHDTDGGSDLAPDSSLNLTSLVTPPAWASSNEELIQLSDAVFEGCETVNDRINAVERYFQQNYSYSLTVTPPEESSQEPLEWFLLNRPPAHCEYFASGSALLLRMAGVPCRYVVGFVVAEQNRYSGEWIARNEDAHAWVEAYDESRGWVTVDATPSAGIPDSTKPSAWTQLYEYLRDEFQRLRVDWQQGGLDSVAASVKAMVLSPLGIGLIAASALTGLGLIVWRTRRRKTPDVMVYASPSSAIALVQPAREKLDRVLKQVWRARLPGETVARYADQLAAAAHDKHDPLLKAAAWYEQYALLRFAHRPDESRIAEISSQANKLTADLRQRRRLIENSASPLVTDS